MLDTITPHKKSLTINCQVCLKSGRNNPAIVVLEKEVSGKKLIKYDCGHFILKDIPIPPNFNTIIFDGDLNCKHAFTLPVKATHKIECHKCGAHRPYPFQIAGMEAAYKSFRTRKGFAILDYMGLGKTIQALGLVKFLTPEQLPVLWIVKSGLKYQFLGEILRILGNSYCPLMILSGKDGVLPGFKNYIISYDTLRTFDNEKFVKLGIKLIVLDEVQQIKNKDSKRAQEVTDLVYKLPEANILPLSGTPWKNRGSELFTMFNLIAPDKFPSFQQFVNQWVDYYLDKNSGKYKEGGIRNIKAFKDYVKDLCIRREPEEVMPEFPPITRTRLLCEIPEIEEAAYANEMDQFAEWFIALTLEGKTANSQEIIAKLARMRHIVGLAKVPFTMEHVQDYLDETDGKILIGVHHQDVGLMLTNQLKEYCRKNHPRIPIVNITSDMDGAARNKAQDIFNKSERAIMVASTLAAGEGLNLQTCDYVYNHERQWNPANEEQFEGRCRRIGQLKKIKSQYPHAKGTTDEHLDRLVDMKRVNFNRVMNHDFIEGLTDKTICKICKKTEAEHELTWEPDNLMQELALALVEDYQKNKKLRVVRTGKK